MALSQLEACNKLEVTDIIFRLLARTAPSMNSKQIWHKNDKTSPNSKFDLLYRLYLLSTY